MLVIRRKDGQSITIDHMGERMTVELNGKTLAIDGPRSFRVQRTEKVAGEPDRVMCSVSSQGGASVRIAELLPITDKTTEGYSLVRYANGSVDEVKNDWITIVHREE
jgi:hypothetical protein